ncbi:glucose-6-phosphate isomerase [Magnetovibrio blakemorei]|uniref:Glucose-6-phosphate isomerase n=1 Tax=Magnetovibrio blakemorei TaxID=28181 RepID=A0A1E5Q669_9PROT|nr:glucose-6-phosphate isomerase [Magnetovibrio blakemorei]
MTALMQSSAWNVLQTHQKEIAALHMRDLFAQEPDRFESFSLRCGEIFLDYSKNRITAQTLPLLFDLARAADVEGWRERMFTGEKINTSENRAVLHVALRNMSNQPIMVDGVDVMPQVQDVLERVGAFSHNVRNGTWRGFNGQRITDIVNIGIGGSNLGPMMVCEALSPYVSPDLKMHFVSNIDGTHIDETLAKLSPETALFIISSKTFTTQETMTNAAAVRDWFLAAPQTTEAAIAHHFVAVSTNVEAAIEFGITADNVFESWDWVGGRYSLWSATGLPIALAVGMDRFTELLAGAHEMDQHYRTAPLEQNMPVILAMLGVWYINFFAAESQAILPYDHHLEHFITYLQQTDMESNGKSVARDGAKVGHLTGPIIWGMPGSDGQHAFFQHLHQGTSLVPMDFLAPINLFKPTDHHHRILLANFFAQTEALMKGKTEQEARADLTAEGLRGERLESLLPYKIFAGNKPSNTILFDQLDPKNLGALIALYEHKIFVQSNIWNVNCFDQWGVELGKKLAGNILPELADDIPARGHDCSTTGLIAHYKARRHAGD